MSGAFDRVFKPYMVVKLPACHVGASFLSFLGAYRALRKRQIVVQESYADCSEIRNNIFQGNVLGSPLWNTFFADVGTPASSTDGREAMFAADLNDFQELDRDLPAHVCQEQLDQAARLKARIYCAIECVGKKEACPLLGQG